MNQYLQDYTIISYYGNNDKNSHWPPKYLKIEIDTSLNREDKDFIRDLGNKIFEEISNPIRQKILNAMGNDLRLDYKPIDMFICYEI